MTDTDTQEVIDLAKLMQKRVQDARFSVLQLAGSEAAATAILSADLLDAATGFGTFYLKTAHGIKAKDGEPRLNPVAILMMAKEILEASIVAALKQEVMAGRDPFRDCPIKPGHEAEAKAESDKLLKEMKTSYSI